MATRSHTPLLLAHVDPGGGVGAYQDDRRAGDPPEPKLRDALLQVLPYIVRYGPAVQRPGLTVNRHMGFNRRYLPPSSFSSKR